MEEPVRKKTRTNDDLDDNVALVLFGVDDLRMVNCVLLECSPRGWYFGKAPKFAHKDIPGV